MIAMSTEDSILFLELAFYSPLVNLDVILFTSKVTSKITLNYWCPLFLLKLTESVFTFIISSKYSLYHNYSLFQIEKGASLYKTAKP